MALVALLETREVTGFVEDSGYGGYPSAGLFFPESGAEENLVDSFTLELGKQYVVVWGDSQHNVVAMDASIMMENAVYLGNGTALEMDGNNEPFIIGVLPEYGVIFISLEENISSRMVGIYQIVDDEGSEAVPDDNPPQESAEGIVLKDRNGQRVEYYGIETVTFDTTTEGKQQTFTKGVAVEGLPIDPDFSGGDMEVVAPPDTLVKSAIIKKPDGLESSNIRKGAVVGGIPGDFTGDTEEQVIELDMAEGNMVIEPTGKGKVISRVEVKKPETMIPDNIAEGVNIAGVVGKFQGGGIENSIRYFSAIIDPVDSKVELTSFDFNKLYNDTQKYEVNIPGTFCKYPVYINHNGLLYSFFNNSQIQNIEIHEDVRYVNNSMARLFNGCGNFNSHVSIPQGVTNIMNLFTYCYKFNQPVHIPNSVISMVNAFSGCNRFNQPITIPNSVTSVYGALYGCTNFNQPVEIPNSVITASQMFYSCSNFNQPVTIPNSVNNIMEMFRSCSKLNKPITFEEADTINYGTHGLYETFASCYNFNQPVVIPDFIVGEMNNTFAYCNRLNSPIVIGNGINGMLNAFLNCSALRCDVIIGTGVKSLTRAFYNAHIGGNIRILSKNVATFNYAFWSGLAATKNTRINIFVPAGSTTNSVIFQNGTYLRQSGNLSWATNANNNCKYNAAWNVYIYWE